MRRILRVGFFLSCLVMLGVNEKANLLCEGFIPENNYQIPVGFVDTGISLAQWTELFDKYEKIYTPVIASRGATLQLNRFWDDATVNASANEIKGIWNVNMFGGLARFPGMTVDGMTIVVCHETGHHLGGGPKWFGKATKLTSEGGADYFATLKCARQMFAGDDNVQIVSQMNLDPRIAASCSAQYADANESAICQRVAAAASVLGTVLQTMSGEKITPAVTTPDLSVVTQTLVDDYPSTQCRVDTYVQGALCKAELGTFQELDYHIGSCTAPHFTIGLRPSCWFKADDEDSSVPVAAQ